VYRKVCFLLFVLTLSADPNVLVTGGAGYIGSHTCAALKRAGFTPIAFDSLIYGLEENVKWGPLIKGDLKDKDLLDFAFQTYQPVAVIHFAALKSVPESVLDPLSYYETNISGTLNLLRAMQNHDVRVLVFSSTCSIYGSSTLPAIDENQPGKPENPYARSKYYIEEILHDVSLASDMRYAALRYFNVAGMESHLKLKKPPFLPLPLISSVLETIATPETPFNLYGTDYPTPDGTAVRDYIHVADIAEAHVLALKHLQANGNNLTLNLGTGKGYSVKEIIQAAEQLTGKQVPCKVAPRRCGDIPQAVADAARAKEIFGFDPVHSDLQNILESEWEALSLHGKKI